MGVIDDIQGNAPITPKPVHVSVRESVTAHNDKDIKNNDKDPKDPKDP
jgi:hypothetical protein